VAEQTNLHVAAEPVLTPHDLTGFLSLLCQELIPAGRYRYILLQGELDQGLGRHLHLVFPGDYFGPCARADARADCCSFAAAGEMIDPTAAPPTVLFAMLAPCDLPVNS
jgi:hypothetical protein